MDPLSIAAAATTLSSIVLAGFTTYRVQQRITREPVDGDVDGVAALGLSVLYEHPDNAVVDIIFVHGLTGHPVYTWKNGNVFWPRDLLREDLPQSRILTFGYDARLFSSSGKNSLTRLSRLLLASLSDLRLATNAEERPTIYVCHSLGGVLVKEALVRAGKNSDEVLSKLYKSTLGLCFFGSPHRGSDASRLLSSIISAAGIKFDSAALQFDPQEAEAWTKIDYDFIRISSSFNILSCWEKRPTTTVKGKTFVVSRDSAILGVPNEQNIGLEAEHRGLCKFDNRDDSNYLIVISIFTTWCEQTESLRGRRNTSKEVHRRAAEAARKATIGEADVGSKLATHDEHIAVIEQERQFLKSLDFEPNTENIIPERYERTCEWILQDAQYRDWIEIRNPSSLWIFGRPGAGKSVMAKFILGRLREEATQSTQHSSRLVLGFFLDARSSQRASTFAFVSSLLYQLLSADSRLFRHVYGRSVFRDQRKTLSSLKEILLNALEDPARYETCIVLDGFDECNPAYQEELLDLIGDLEAISGVKLLCTSRALLLLFPRFKNSIQLDHHNYSDCQLFTSAEIRRLNLPSKLQEEVTNALMEKSDGSFLLAKQHLESLQNLKTARTVRAVIDMLPSNVEESIKRALNILPEADKELVLQALYFTINAKTHLTSSSLTNLLAAAWASSEASEPTEEDVQEKALLDEAGFIAELRPFLRVEQSQLVLTHQTVREFLEYNPMFPPLSLPLPRQAALEKSSTSIEHPKVRTVPGFMALACLSCIHASLKRFENQMDADELNYPLDDLAYASIYWMEHVREARSGNAWTVPGLLRSIVDHPSKAFQTLINRVRDHLRQYVLLPEWHSSLIFVLGAFDLLGALKVFYPIGNVDLELKDANERGPLHLMAANNATESIEEVFQVLRQEPRHLMELLTQEDLGGMCPLAYAIVYAHVDLCRRILGTVNKKELSYKAQTQIMDAMVQSKCREVFLLFWDYGYVPHGTRTEQENALQLAIDFDAFKVCQALVMENHSLVKTALTHKETPLHIAAQSSRVDLVTLLLDHGAGVIVIDSEGKTPLHRAVLSSHVAIVKLLLDRGSSVNLMDKSGRSVVHYASQNGHDQVLRILVEHGSDIMSYDRQGQTPLHLAAREGREAAVAYLLEAGAEVGAGGRGGETPLSYAAASGNLSLVSLLINAGANVSAHDDHGRTPLHLATKCGSEFVVRGLLDMGAGVNARDKDGKTPLHYACDTHQASMPTLKQLIDCGADPNARDYVGQTPLHYATRSHSLDTVQFLLDRGAEANAADKQGHTPLQIAVDFEDAALTQFIRRAVENVMSTTSTLQ